jgi:fatty-acyl-CoA synthase
MSAALSYSSGESATPLLGDTIGGNFDATVWRFGDREALVDRPASRRWTYTELAADVDALALGLPEMGIEKGDRVGIWAPNCAEWTLTQYATAKIKLLIAAQRLKTSDYAAMITKVRPGCHALAHVVLTGTPEWHALIETGRGLDRSALQRIQLDTDDPSTSSTPQAPPVSRRARLFRTTTSSTTRSSSASCATTLQRTGSAFRCRSTIASAWSWVISRPPATAPA